MTPFKIYTIAGKSTPHELPLAVEYHQDLFIAVFGPKLKVEKTIEKIQNFEFVNPIEELQTFLKKEANGEEKSNILIVKLKNNVLYAGAVGQMTLLLKRNGKFNPLINPSEKEKTLSGFIKENDVFFLLSTPASEILSNIEDKTNIENIASIMNEKLTESKSHNKISAVILSFEKPVKTTTEAVIPAEILEENTPEIIEDFQEKKESFFSKFSVILFNLIKSINIKIAKLIGVVIIFIIVAIFAINVIGKITKAAKEKIQEETKKIEEIQNNLGIAKELLNLNNVRAEEIANQVTREIKKIDLNKITSAENKKKLADLTKELNDVLKKSTSVETSNAALVYSVTALKKNSTVTDFVLSGSETFILDSSQNLVYAVNFSTKKAEIVDLKKFIKTPRSIIVGETNVFVLSEDAILQIDTDSKKVKTTFKSDSEWGKINKFASYFGNLYLLDEKNGQIWKYLKNDTGFALVQPYLVAKTDLSTSASLGIDSLIYVLFKNGELKTYLKGEEQTFKLGKIPNKSLKNPTQLIISFDLTNLYILEPSQKRIIIFDKKGKYMKQLVDNKLANAKTFDVSEKDKTIFFSVGADIYKINF